MLSGLTAPTSGDAVVLGRSITDGRGRREHIDVSMQETAIARKLTVGENIEFYASLNGQTKSEIEESKEYIYGAFGLGSVKNKRAGKLSGGWQRKLSVALALVSKPKILFLDEPTLGLDVIARRELWKTITSLKGKMTVILTTHYMEEAQALCSRVALVNRGRLQKLDTPENLIAELGPYAVDETGENGLKSRYFPDREAAIAFLRTAGEGASLRTTTLEDVFVDCAGRKLTAG